MIGKWYDMILYDMIFLMMIISNYHFISFLGPFPTGKLVLTWWYVILKSNLGLTCAQAELFVNNFGRELIWDDIISNNKWYVQCLLFSVMSSVNLLMLSSEDEEPSAEDLLIDLENEMAKICPWTCPNRVRILLAKIAYKVHKEKDPGTK
jgi:hypothetical protein